MNGQQTFWHFQFKLEDPSLQCPAKSNANQKKTTTFNVYHRDLKITH